MDDMIEEGEIESDEHEEVYKKLVRPQTNVISNIARTSYNSDSSTNSESDERIPRNNSANHSRSSLSKNGSMWKNMLQEESLMENLKTCDVSTERKRKYERGPESYDFEKKSEANAANGVKFPKRQKIENESESSSSSSSFKRARKNRAKQRKKVLPDLDFSLLHDSNEIGQVMARNLREEKSQLIVQVVAEIGKEASFDLYRTTQKIEREGGMLTINKKRRRTPGGVFLFLVKTSNNIEENAKRQIFDLGHKRNEKSIADRKLSSEQTEAKDPPNSPANSDLVKDDLVKNDTDPNLVSQKINEKCLKMDF